LFICVILFPIFVDTVFIHPREMSSTVLDKGLEQLNTQSTTRGQISPRALHVKRTGLKATTNQAQALINGIYF